MADTPRGRRRAPNKPSGTPGRPDAGPAGETQGMYIILAALQSLKEGSVEVVVHEGRITYVERREKESMNLSCPPLPAEYGGS